MKKYKLIAIFFIVLILLLTTVSPVMAKPINSSWTQVIASSFTDTDGHEWFLSSVNYVDPTPTTPDKLNIQCYDISPNVNYSTGEGIRSSINFNRGTAGIVTWKVSNDNLSMTLILAGSDTSYLTAGTGDRTNNDTFYLEGPGTVQGTLTYNNVTYTFDFTSSNTSDFLSYEKREQIVK